MPNPADQAGSAAPTLPAYAFSPGNTVGVAVAARRASAGMPDRVAMLVDEAEGYAAMTPSEARLLAVYLVDCANALDNPAQRVIVDDLVGEGIGHA